MKVDTQQQNLKRSFFPSNFSLLDVGGSGSAPEKQHAPRAGPHHGLALPGTGVTESTLSFVSCPEFEQHPMAPGGFCFRNKATFWLPLCGVLLYSSPLPPLGAAESWTCAASEELLCKPAGKGCGAGGGNKTSRAISRDTRPPQGCSQCGGAAGARRGFEPATPNSAGGRPPHQATRAPAHSWRGAPAPGKKDNK